MLTRFTPFFNLKSLFTGIKAKITAGELAPKESSQVSNFFLASGRDKIVT